MRTQPKQAGRKPSPRVAGRLRKGGRALLAVLVPAALLALFAAALPVTRCLPQGATRYSAAELAAAMGLGERQTRLFTLDKPALARRIHAALPYAHVTSIKRLFPNALRVAVEEWEPVFAQEQDGRWWLLSVGGKLLECAAQPPHGALPLSGFRLQSPKAGAYARWEGAFTAPGDLSALRDALMGTPLWPEITGLRISTAALPDALYQDRIQLRFGAAFAPGGAGEALGDKLRMAEQVLARLDAQNPGNRGLLDLGTPGKATFTPEWERWQAESAQREALEAAQEAGASAS